MKLKLIYLSIIFVMLTGCHKHTDNHTHEGHTHDTPLLLVGYNDLFEAFLEAEPFALGKQSSVTLYLTELPNIPAEVNAVTVSLIVGNKGIRQTQETFVQPGVYRFALTPEATGNAKISINIQSSKGNSQIEVNDVVVFEDAHTAEHTAEEQAEHHPDAISFNKMQQWRIDFATTLPGNEPFGQVIRTTGQIISSQTDENRVVAKASGVVVFNRNILEGQSVSAGQELFTVSSAGMAEDNVNVLLIEAHNNFIKAEGDYKRAQELIEDNIVSSKEFLEIKSTYENSKAVYDNLYKNFSDKGQRASSSGAGFIKQLLVSNGEYVEAGQVLAIISRNKSLLLKADVPMKYASLLHSISTANFRTMNNQKTYSLEDLNGKILSYGKTVNEDNFMLPVSFQMDNKADFIPGSFVEVFIRTKSDVPVMTIPSSALTEEQGAFFVYVQLTPETFGKRQVSIGMTDGIKTEILNGLNSTDRLVSKGAISVKLAQSAGALDPHAGHVH
ncbi:MAG: efflux RND transporter periplasmic adaptor subunit [Bacteroidales bacterium]|nr:efflux RND transporter periplasmic adaptor subunit [Bacteroidales bacterium]